MSSPLSSEEGPVSLAKLLEGLVEGTGWEPCSVRGVFGGFCLFTCNPEDAVTAL